MSKPNHTPTIAGDIRRIHLVITRALDVAIEHTSLFADHQNSDLFSDGFINYVESFISLLHSHHLVEDEQIFPYLQTKLPNAPFEIMETQHQEMLPILHKIQEQLASIKKRKLRSLELLIAFNQQLIKMRQLWHPHFEIEEEFINDDLLKTVIDPDEQIRLSHAFAEYGGQHIVADYLVMPFILYNLAPEERAVMSQVFPPVVTEQLIPVDWRLQWESMLPFLHEEVG